MATLQLEVLPSTKWHFLPPGDYILELILGAASAKPETVWVRLHLTGGWSLEYDKMIPHLLTVSLPSKAAVEELIPSLA